VTRVVRDINFLLRIWFAALRAAGNLDLGQCSGGECDQAEPYR
jgi:hypothetical protein